MHCTMWEWRLYDASCYMGVEAVRCIVLDGSECCMMHCTIWEWRLYDAS